MIYKLLIAHGKFHVCLEDNTILPIHVRLVAPSAKGKAMAFCQCELKNTEMELLGFKKCETLCFHKAENRLGRICHSGAIKLDDAAIVRSEFKYLSDFLYSYEIDILMPVDLASTMTEPCLPS